MPLSTLNAAILIYFVFSQGVDLGRCLSPAKPYGRMRAIALLVWSLVRDCDAVQVQKTRQGVCGFRRHEATKKPYIFCHAVLLTARYGYNEGGYRDQSYPSGSQTATRTRRDL